MASHRTAPAEETRSLSPVSGPGPAEAGGPTVERREGWGEGGRLDRVPPHISVVIPTYHRDGTLLRLLETLAEVRGGWAAVQRTYRPDWRPDWRQRKAQAQPAPGAVEDESS